MPRSPTSAQLAGSLAVLILLWSILDISEWILGDSDAAIEFPKHVNPIGILIVICAYGFGA